MSKTRMGKRVASLLLTLVMMLSLLPTTVYATGDTGETKGTIVGEANTSDDNTVGGTTSDPEATSEDETAAVATIGEAKYETLDAAIEAVADGQTIVVNAGEYKLNGNLSYTGKAFTIAAAEGADVSFDMSAAVALHGAKITFNNVTFDYKTNGNYIGLQHADTLVYDNCTINGMVFLYAVNETFNGCTFNQTSAGAYNVWTYGAQNVAFNGCTFNCVGRCVLVYNEGTDHKTDLTVTKTSFNASAPVTGKAAIEIDTSLMKNGGATITVDEQTRAEGFAAGSNSGNSLWNDKMQTADTNKNTTVTVGGVEVFVPKATASAAAQIGETTYETLAEAIAAANNGETVTLLTNLDLSATGLTIAKDKAVTLDLNGKTLKVANTNSGNIKVVGKLTLEDSTDTDKNGTGTGKVWTETPYVYNSQDKVLVAAIDGGTFIMESGLIDAASFTADNTNEGQFAVSVQNENADATVIINGGCIKAGWYAIAGNGQDTKYNGNITVNGGILESTADYAIYHPHSGTTTINGGVVFGAAGGVSLNRGKLIVNNGIITSKGTGTTGDWGDGTGNQNAAAINVNAQYGLASVEIKGGKITAEKDAILLTNGKDGTISVSGGTFSSAVKEEYCATGYIPKDNGDGTYGVKAGAYVAQIGDVKYETLQAAIDAVKANETIYVLGNIDLGTDELSTYDVKTTVKNVTIDLGGYTVTSAGRFTVYLQVNGWTIQNGTIQNTNASTTYGTLYVGGRSNSTTLKNLTVESKTNGVQFAIASSKNGIKASITVEDGTKISGNYGVYMKGQPKPWRDTRDGQEILNVNGGEITGTTAAIAVFGAGKGNTKAGVIVNINGGKVYSDSYAIAGNGSSVLENTTINISGGKVFSNKDTAIYHPQAGTVTISGGEVYGVTGGVQMCAGTLNVTGGTISATGNGDVSGKTGDGSIPDGAAVSIVNRAYPAGAPTMTISGGMFTSAAGVGAVQAYGWKNNSQQTWDKPNASVSGGTFSSAVKEEYCATGYIPTANADGTYGVKEGVYVAKVDNVKYETLQAAITAAQDTKDGATITLLTDINTSSYYEVKGENPVTIDLAGHNITGSGISGLFYVTVKGDLTIKGEGTVTAVEDNKAAMAVWVCSSFAKVTLEGGTYTQQITNTADPHFDLIYVERGNVYVKGGTYKGFTPDWTLNCKDEYYQSKEANIEVTGGTFVGFDPANNKAEGENTNFVAAGYVSNVNEDGSYTVVPADAKIDVKRSLTLGNTLIMNYKVLLPEGYTNPHIVFESYDAKAGAFYSVPVADYTLQTKDEETRYVFAFTETNPQRMTDTLKATVYATKGETEKAFPVDDYSVADYCNELLDSAANEKGAYNELVGNLVAYGTAAQLYQNYHTDKLVKDVVNGGTAVTYPISEAVEVNNLNKVAGGVAIETKSLVLNNAFAIRVKFTLEDNTTIDQVKFTVAVDGKTTTIGSESFREGTLSNGTSCYYFDFADLNSRQLGSTVTFTAVVNGTNNDVLEFSANTYLKLMAEREGVSTELMNLLTTLYNYGCTCDSF